MYVNFRRYSVEYDLEKDVFSVYYDGKGEIIRSAGIREIVSKRDPQVSLQDFEKPTASVSYTDECAQMTVSYSGAKMIRQNASITFKITTKGVTLFNGGEGTASVLYAGLIRWGDHSQRETMAVNLSGANRTLRSAYGPAASIYDNALFDRDTDSALVFETSGKFRLKYDWENDCYAFSMNTMGWDFARALTIRVEKDVYARKFDVEYKKVNPNSTFKTPPVGWMTWYAVQFKASEKTVLENTEWQKKNLKKYGADTVWVDWEWYHRNFTSMGGDDHDMYHPDPISYPHGLKYVAEKIEEAGFTPALWIGPTSDPSENEMIKKYPDAVLARKPLWCGQYHMDVTNPHFLEEMLPKMVRQAPEWGYKAIKWDCLPNTTTNCDEHKENRYDQSISSREAMMNMFRKAREILGKDYYMLYCAGVSERDMDLACSVFDAARIGGDIFRWEEFISQCVDKVYKYYMLHTVVCNNDPDNVVIREEFNTLDQAVTRAALVSLMGLPFTLGDNLPDLPEERVEILRRSIPPIPAHPMDIRTGRSDQETVIINLNVERPDLAYNVVDIVNLATVDRTIPMSFTGELGLDEGAYHVYDYWNRQYLGCMTDGFRADLRGCASRIFAVHKAEGRPQMLSTSRHISQGVLDVLNVAYDEDAKKLYGTSKVIGGEAYEIVVWAPEGMKPEACGDVEELNEGAWRVTFRPAEDGTMDWEIKF